MQGYKIRFVLRTLVCLFSCAPAAHAATVESFQGTWRYVGDTASDVVDVSQSGGAVTLRTNRPLSVTAQECTAPQVVDGKTATTCTISELPGMQAHLDLGDSGDQLLAGGVGIGLKVNAGGGDDAVESGTGEDTILGGPGSDALNAGDGADTVIGGVETDTVNGGAGADTIAYTEPGRTSGVTVNLLSDTGPGGEAPNAFENVVGTQFGDTFVGDDGPNTLDGAAGSDTMDGLGGADVLLGGEGNDVGIDGGDGNDTIDPGSGNDGTGGNANSTEGGPGNDTIYASLGADGDIFGGTVTFDSPTDVDTITYGDPGRTGPVTVDLLSTEAGDGSTAVDGTAEHARGFENLVGSSQTSGTDVLIGSSGPNRIDGGPGVDVIDGGAGADELVGGSGRDFLRGGVGDDVLEGGAEADDLRGGADMDVATYRERSAPVVIVLDSGRSLPDGDTAETDVETFEGGAGDDVLRGTSGEDRLNGLGGADRLIGADGADTLDGGAGADVASYEDRVAPLTFDLDAAERPDGDAWTAIEGIVGTQGDDVLMGTIAGDHIDGGGGNDIVQGDLGADVLSGGAGRNTVSYDDAARGVGAATVINLVTGANPDDDTLNSFQDARGTPGPDVIEGRPDEANTLDGAGGDDLLLGGSGIPDTIRGGGGTDVASHRDGRTVGVVVDLSGSAPAVSDGDLLEGIERFEGSDAADVLRGGNGDDHLRGAGGADELLGAGGVDDLGGGAGDDTVAARDGAADTVDCGAGTDGGSADAADALSACETVAIPDPDVTIPTGTVPPASPAARDVVGRFKVKRGAATVLSLVALDVVAGARVRVTCRAKGRSRAARKACAFRTRTLSVPAARAQVVLTKLFGRRRLTPGTVIRVRTEAPARDGREITLTVRRRGQPTRKIACLTPAGARAVCPG